MSAGFRNVWVGALVDVLAEASRALWEAVRAGFFVCLVLAVLAVSWALVLLLAWLAWLTVNLW